MLARSAGETSTIRSISLQPGPATRGEPETSILDANSDRNATASVAQYGECMKADSSGLH
jgi:hypothetical protein